MEINLRELNGDCKRQAMRKGKTSTSSLSTYLAE